MTPRAVAMARIMTEEWPEGETAEVFVRRRFWNDTLADLKKAIAIFREITEADARFEELKPWIPQ